MTAYERLLELAEGDARILGIILSGSRGRGTAVSASDPDCYAIVANGCADDLRASIDCIADVALDVRVLAATEFERYALPGTAEDWEAYAFVHARMELDRLDGGVAEIASRKEMLDGDVADAMARRALDDYVNAAVRSAKCRRDGQWAAAILDASGSVRPATELIFALHERIRLVQPISRMGARTTSALEGVD